MDCEFCEYQNAEENTCGALECNGTGCPDLPCERWWVFTFGWGQPHQGKYVRIRGTYGQARKKMIEKYGLHWAFQYSAEEWRKAEENPERCWPLETELEVIE